ncbi:MAG: ImmA/IrrE family metallo-endopeptidase [Nitrospirota bacterium]
MRRIIQKAKEIYKRYGLDELDLLASKLGVEIYEILEAKNIKEVYFPDLRAIAINPDLPPYERNYLIAHALGHHLFHKVGLKRDYINLHERGVFGSLELGRREISIKEREADIFAAYLLIPEEKLTPLLEEDRIKEAHSDPLSELAEEFQVPEELMRRRVEFEKIPRGSGRNFAGLTL